MITDAVSPINKTAMRLSPGSTSGEFALVLYLTNEVEGLDALWRLAEGRTTFVISHDREAIADVDLLVRIEGGRVAEVTRPRRAAAAARAAVTVPSEEAQAHAER